MTAGIHKCGVAVNNSAAPDLHGAYFGYTAGRDRKTCRLNIEHHDLIGKRARPFAEKRTGAVVYKVCLKTVNDLHVRFFGGDHSLWESLNVCVVGDGDSLVSPPLGGIHRIGGGDYRVHCRHICMEMKLHAFFIGGILARQALYFGDIRIVKQHIGRIFVHPHIALGGNYHTVEYDIGYLCGILGFKAARACLYRRVAVKNTEGDEHSAASARFLAFEGADLADDADPAARRAQKRYRLRFYLKRLAYYVIRRGYVKCRRTYAADAVLNSCFGILVIGGIYPFELHRRAFFAFASILTLSAGLPALSAAVISRCGASAAFRFVFLRRLGAAPVHVLKHCIA